MSAVDAPAHVVAPSREGSEHHQPVPQRGLGSDHTAHSSKRGCIGEAVARFVAGCLLPICWCCFVFPCCEEYVAKSGVEDAAASIGTSVRELRLGMSMRGADRTGAISRLGAGWHRWRRVRHVHMKFPNTVMKVWIQEPAHSGTHVSLARARSTPVRR
eukprot:PRCOL_00000655-RA